MRGGAPKRRALENGTNETRRGSREGRDVRAKRRVGGGGNFVRDRRDRGENKRDATFVLPAAATNYYRLSAVVPRPRPNSEFGKREPVVQKYVIFK